jgi:hypothetical protein
MNRQDIFGGPKTDLLGGKKVTQKFIRMNHFN